MKAKSEPAWQFPVSYAAAQAAIKDDQKQKTNHLTANLPILSRNREVLSQADDDGFVVPLLPEESDPDGRSRKGQRIHDSLLGLLPGGFSC